MSAPLLAPPLANNQSSSFPSSPAGSNFTPRKEFFQAPTRQSSFALLAFTSNNAIRLSNFPETIVAALRSLLDSVVGLHSFRENAEHKLCEIILLGKPWSNPKSLSTEVVLVQVFTVLFSHGYSFLSQLDYGREHNDRLSLAFSKPASPPQPDPSSLPHLKHTLSVPFALSFPSPTSLKVVCSPLHSTPAILQSVRGAWPRGISSEKKIGEGCFEFKLKGYSWFQEDTFPEDSLANILNLLTALDKHSWTLVTSISLSANHARTKDLWIFSGPDTISSPKDTSIRPASPVQLGSPLKPSVYEPIVDHNREGSGDSEDSVSGFKDEGPPTQASGATQLSGHRGSQRLIKTPKETDGHARVASDSTAVLRKKSPPKLSVDESTSSKNLLSQSQPGSGRDATLGAPPTAAHFPRNPQPDRANTVHVTALPAIPFPQEDNLPPQPQTPIGPPPSHPLDSLPEPVEEHHADIDDATEDRNVHATRDDQALRKASQYAEAHGFHITPGSEVSTPPLLAPAAFSPSTEFRDSAFSGHSFDVPITWIPAPERGMEEAFGRHPPGLPGGSLVSISTNTTGPLPPGGWAPTPVAEVEDPIAAPRKGTSQQGKSQRKVSPAGGTPRQSTVVSHSPQIVHPELPGEDAHDLPSPRRKSETGVMGVVPNAKDEIPPVPGVPSRNGDAENKEDLIAGKELPKEGWVLVNVAPDTPPAFASSTAAVAVTAASEAGETETTMHPKSEATAPVLASQLIAAADAVVSSSSPAANSVTSSPSISGISSQAPSPVPQPEKSGLSRLFSRRLGSGGGVQKTRSADHESDSDNQKEKDKRSRFRKRTGVLSTIRSGKRISID
ncbi:hypothetical protein K439DRAFT_1636238 [Ramaria rubella]|nr:hypothetical protein K439DRAFT_1636238 [Ramaria rubella]